MSPLQQAALFLVAAVVFVPLFRWLKLSSILGYVAAGVILGPWGLGLINDVESILHASEFGVVLLMFVIGLELQPSRLWALRRAVFGMGSGQVLSCTILIAAAAFVAGVGTLASAIVGFGLALSSTALVLQVLAERGQLKAAHGRSAFGILLFQDIAVLPVLAILPLATRDAQPLGESLFALGRLFLVMAAVVVGGRVLLKPVLRLIARTRVTEVFTAAALLIVIGMALAVSAVGLSMSLGAFMAGVLLADSEFRHELEADIEPFKGLLLGLFFIAVGMSANLGLITGEPLVVLAVTLGFMALKFVAIAALGRVARLTTASSLKLGLSLMAGGEFAFVLFTLAATQGALESEIAERLVLAVTLSMIAGPLMSAAYEAAAKRWVRRDGERPYDTIDPSDGKVLIAGFGRFGQVVGRVLRAKHIEFTALDASSANIDFIRRFGAHVYYGDASRLDMLRAAGADHATVMLVAIDDVEASLRCVGLARQHFPHLRVIARARNRQHAFRLMELGVRLVIRETYASSLETAVAVLEAIGESATSARSTARRFREHDEKTLLRQFAVRDDDSKLIASAAESARQLEQLFESDRKAALEAGEVKTVARTGTS